MGVDGTIDIDWSGTQRQVESERAQRAVVAADPRTPARAAEVGTRANDSYWMPAGYHLASVIAGMPRFIAGDAAVKSAMKMSNFNAQSEENMAALAKLRSDMENNKKPDGRPNYTPDQIDAAVRREFDAQYARTDKLIEEQFPGTEQNKKKKGGGGFFNKVGDVAGGAAHLAGNVVKPVGRVAAEGVDIVVPERVEDAVGYGVQHTVTSDVAKGAARTGFSAMEAPYQEGVGYLRNAASAAKGAALQSTNTQGGDFAQRSQAAAHDVDFTQSQSDFGVAVGQLARGENDWGEFFLGRQRQRAKLNPDGSPVLDETGQPVMEEYSPSLGSGFLPDKSAGAPQEAAQRARDVYSIAGQAWTPGRMAASMVVEPGTAPYNVISGLTDAGVAWWFDPTNKAFDAIAEGRKARDAFELYGLIPGHRYTNLPEVADAWMSSREGIKRLEGFAGEGDWTKIWRKFDRQIDPELAQKLAGEGTVDGVRAVLRPHIGVDIASRGDIPQLGTVMDQLGSATYRRWKENARFLHDVPVHEAYIDDHIGTLKALDDQMANINMAVEKRDAILAKVGASLTDRRNTTVTAQALKGVEEAMAAQLEHYGVDATRAADVTGIISRSYDEMHRFAQTEIGENLQVKFIMNNGEAVPLVGPHLLSEQMARKLELPDPRQLKRLASHMNGLWDNKAWTGSVDALEHIQGVWKKWVLLRGAYVVRVIADEQMRMAADGYASMFDHPGTWLSYLAGEENGKIGPMLKKLGVQPRGVTDVFGNEFNMDVMSSEFAQAVGRRAKESKFEDALARRTMYTNDYKLTNIGSSDYAGGWADEMAKLYQDDIMRRVGGGGISDEDMRLLGMNVPESFDIQRLHDPAMNPLDTADMPQGAYYSVGDDEFDAVRANGQATTKANVRPNNPLRLPPKDPAAAAQQHTPFVALQEMLGTQEAHRLSEMLERSAYDEANDLLDTLGIKARIKASDFDHIPASQVGPHRDAIAAGIIARSKGHDAIIQEGPRGFSEFSVLDRKLLEGGPQRNGIENVKEWLWKNDDLRADLNKLYADRGANFADRAVSDGYVDSLIDRWHEMAKNDPSLQAIFETGKLPSGVTAFSNGRPTHELVAHLRELSKNGVGPKFVKVRGQYLDRARKQQSGIVDHFFQMLAGKPTAHLSRSPTFRQAYWERMASLSRGMDSEARNLLLKQAEEQIEPATRALFHRDGTFEKLLSNVKGKPGTLTLEQADSAAKTWALEHTKGLLYDTTKRSQWADTLRIISPFAEAWREQITIWSGLFKDPSNIRRGQQLVQGARGAGFFYRDPTTGEEMFNYPMSGALAEVFTGLNAPLRGRVQGLSLMGSVQPGLGPIMSIGMSTILPDSPTYDSISKFLMPYGETDVEPGVLERTFVPSSFSNLIRAATADPQRDRVFGNFVGDVMAAQAMKGDYGNTAEERQRLYNDSVPKARVLYMMRALGPLVGGMPSAPSIDLKTELPEGVDVSVALMSQDFNKMQSENYETAVQRFTEKYGDDAFMFMATKSLNKVGGQLASTEYGVWERNNDNFIEAYPDIAGYFGPDTEGYDFTVYNRQMRENRRAGSPPTDRFDRGQSIVAGFIYRQKRDSLPENMDAGQRAWLRQWKGYLLEEYPGWNPEGFVNNQPKAMRQLIEVNKSASMIETPTGQALATYMDKRNQALQTLKDRGLTSDEAAFSQSQGAADLRAWLYSWGQHLTEEQPEFGRLWNNVLSREVDDSAAEEDAPAVTTEPLEASPNG